MSLPCEIEITAEDIVTASRGWSTLCVLARAIQRTTGLNVAVGVPLSRLGIVFEVSKTGETVRFLGKLSREAAKLARDFDNGKEIFPQILQLLEHPTA